VMLHALAARTGDAAEPGSEVLDQGRLADARLPGDPGDGPAAAYRAIPDAPKPRQLRETADEQGRRFRIDLECARRRGGMTRSPSGSCPSTPRDAAR
jgi:hypothetical protein